MEENVQEGRAEGRLKRVVPYVLLVVLVFGVYAGSLPGTFGYDDYGTVVENAFIKSAGGLRYLFSARYYEFFAEYSYRPMVTLTYFADYAVWKGSELGYHLTNVALHAGMVLLVFLLLRELFGRGLGAFLGAALFAVHPVLTEAVNGISFREDLLAGVFYVGALLAYVRGREGGRNGLVLVSVVLFVVALLSKEMAATLPLILLVYELTFRPGSQKRGLAWVGVFLVMALGYGLLRVTALHDPAEVGASYPGESFGVNLLTMLWVFARYGALVFFPRGLSIHHYVPAVVSMGDPRAIVGIVAAVCYGVIVVLSFRWDRRVGLGLVWYPITLLPVSNVIPISNIMAERYLYLPMVSFGLVWGAMVRKLGREMGWGVGVRVAGLALIPVLGLVTVARNVDWSDEVRLWGGAVELYPASARAHCYLGVALGREGEHEAEAAEYRRALALPTELNVKTVALYNLAHSLRALGRMRESIRALEKVVAVSPGESRFQTSLGAAYLRVGELDSAKGALERAVELNPGDYVALSNLGVIAQMEGRLDDAVGIFRRVTELAPKNGEFYTYLALALIEKGRGEEAVRELEVAGRLAGDDVVVLANVGAGYLRVGMFNEAEMYLLRGVALDELNAHARALLGEVYFHKRVFAKAIPYLEEAVEMNPEDFGSLYRLGVAWERMGEREKAKEAFLRFIKGWEGDASYMKAAEEKLEELEGKVP